MLPVQLNVEKEKKALQFLLKLLILMCLLKCIFFFYNYRISDGWHINDVGNAFLILKWSLIYDVLVIAIINLPLFIKLMFAAKMLANRTVQRIVSLFFAVLNAFIIFLNTTDIFYYRFHLQRADADLLYVLRSPFNGATLKVVVLSFVILVFFLLICGLMYKWILQIIRSAGPGNHFFISNILLSGFICLFILTGTKKILPSYPLTEIEAVQLPLSQNSLHCFLYSLFRKNDALVPARQYMELAKQESLFSIHKKMNSDCRPKNIVLFIMESVPSDFFIMGSPYKVTMTFLDSLVNKITYFENAFSYSYNSNKGITAILAGIPTLTDIPLYHSGFTMIHKMALGAELAKRNYESSFFIGDNYDDFGFAKCCRWLGIQHYYCRKDIPGNEQMENHSLGLHDEYVLNFMQQKLRNSKEPFFATQYNISTHYPNDLPATFTSSFAANKTPPMKTMQYYNDCLEKFFKEASSQAWYKNSVFIFCSDHWAQPGTDNMKMDVVESFRIPVFIYEPGHEKKQRISALVSQLDIMNTVLYFAGAKGSIISYGENLKDSLPQENRPVFSKINSTIYEAINQQYVLGFNAIEGKPTYCYNYRNDAEKKSNLLLQVSSPSIDSLVLQMKAFLQTAARHYRP